MNLCSVSLTVSGVFSLIASCWMVKKVIDCPSLFNPGIGRIIAALAFRDLIFSIAILPSSTLFFDPFLCYLQATIIYICGLVAAIFIAGMCIMVFNTIVLKCKVMDSRPVFFFATLFVAVLLAHIFLMHDDDGPLFAPNNMWCFISQDRMDQFFTHYYIYRLAALLVCMGCFTSCLVYLQCNRSTFGGKNYRKNRHRLMALRLCASYLVATIILSIPRVYIGFNRSRGSAAWQVLFGTFAGADGWVRLIAWINTYYRRQFLAYWKCTAIDNFEGGKLPDKGNVQLDVLGSGITRPKKAAISLFGRKDGSYHNTSRRITV